VELDLYELISANPALGLFLIVAFGYLIGELKIRGFQFGSSTGVLLVALLFGHLGFRPDEPTESIGFMLFIYCVGLQAGPQFFSAFREQGAKFVSLAFVTAALSFTLALVLARAFDFAPGYSAGLLAGALTSTPTLVAARDAIQGGMAALPPGATADIVAGNVTVSYAITYLFGLAGLVVLIGALPRMLGIDLAKESAELARERKRLRPGAGHASSRAQQPALRAYRVLNETALGRSLEELQLFEQSGCLIEKVKRGEALIEPDAETHLEANDLVAVVGQPAGLAKLGEILGPEVADAELLDLAPETHDVVLTQNNIVGRTVGDLRVPEQYGCLISAVTRAGMDLEVSPDLPLQRSDILKVTGMKSRLEQFAGRVGHMERDIHETDLVTFAFGIAAGIFVGTFSVKIGQLSVGLGTAGGLLAAGLVFGFLRSIHPTFGRVPQAARYVLMELGLLFFMASIGVRAGADIVPALKAAGPLLILAGVLVTVVPTLLAFFFGRHVLGLHPVILLGGITGSMTSTPALGILTKQAGNSLPVIGYAGTYTFANVILAFAGSLMMRL
jgi:putative transport protein